MKSIQQTKKQKPILLIIIVLLMIVGTNMDLQAQTADNIIADRYGLLGLSLVLLLGIIPLFILIMNTYFSMKNQDTQNDEWEQKNTETHFSDYIQTLNQDQIHQFIKMKRKKCSGNCKNGGSCDKINNTNNPSKIITFLFLFFSANTLFAQTPATNVPKNAADSLFSQPGIIITIILMSIPVLLGVFFVLVKANNAIKNYFNSLKMKEAEKFAEHIKTIDDKELEKHLIKRENALSYHLNNTELSGTQKAEDTKGIIQNVDERHYTNFLAKKRKATQRPILAPDITKLILWYLGCATFWLVVGTGVGQYLGTKFLVPDMEQISWLSFGRLRPVHTNIVFWGWASLAMIGLGYYVVPTVSNTKIYSVKMGWIALVLTNLMVIFGSLCLMSGFNNGGGEFREYVWPVMALFAVALILTLINFIMTVANRTTKEIYISNWYIVSSLIFTIIVALTAYLPFWQDGVSETIVQGYFMHSGVGMWFTLYTLGLLYYFIPQQINRPIYAYSLGILAFWAQIIFYTIIGTHHFVFAPIAWWLQTVAIVGSAGMIIPVFAGTINFIVTFKGQWNKVTNSYTLPFFLVAVIYYFIVSMQGTAQAFKFTNLIWHFTDFTVAHSHLGFYGIITFALWGAIYAIVPRLTGQEPPQHLVGVHFWVAFIGLLFYAIPLSIGATLKGLMWMEGKPFIDSVVLMFQYWLWRAIGGSLMFISHLVFAYSFYKMVAKEIPEVDVKEEAFKLLQKS